MRDVWLRTGLSPAVLELLAAADAFRSIGLDRREALWAVRGLNRSATRTISHSGAMRNCANSNPTRILPPMRRWANTLWRITAQLSLSLKAHPVWFLRSDLGEEWYRELRGFG